MDDLARDPNTASPFFSEAFCLTSVMVNFLLEIKKINRNKTPNTGIRDDASFVTTMHATVRLYAKNNDKVCEAAI